MIFKTIKNNLQKQLREIIVLIKILNLGRILNSKIDTLDKVSLINNFFERYLPNSNVPKIKKIEIIVENIDIIDFHLNKLIKKIFTFDSLHYL